MTRETLPALGYLYVALALPALIVGPDDQRLQATLLTGAVFAYFWFIASLVAQGDAIRARRVLRERRRRRRRLRTSRSR